MERTRVSSSNISSIGYESDSQILEIEFNHGAIYQYFGVPEYEYDGMMNSDSKGTYLNSNIKGRYLFAKL